MFKWITRLFGCAHRHTTFPLTHGQNGTYVTCTDCGKEFGYNWEEMKIGEEIEIAYR